MNNFNIPAIFQNVKYIYRYIPVISVYPFTGSDYRSSPVNR